MSISLLLTGVIFTSSAQIFLKLAGFHEINSIHWYLLIVSSVMSYGISFAVYAAILKLYPISRVAPVMTVGTVILVVLFGVIIGERLSASQVSGLALGSIAIMLLLN